MTDETAGEQNTNVQFTIQRVYVKDISYEVPNAPQCFSEEWNPKVQFDLNSNAKGVAENTFEVELTVTVEVKNNDKVAYLIEVKQAGIFSISNAPDEDLRAMLGSFCPNILFPYAREAVSDIVTRGSFPQMLLAPINFDALYEQHLQQQNQQAEEAAKH